MTIHLFESTKIFEKYKRYESRERNLSIQNETPFREFLYPTDPLAGVLAYQLPLEAAKTSPGLVMVIYTLDALGQALSGLVRSYKEGCLGHSVG